MKIYEIIKNTIKKYRSSKYDIDYESAKLILKNDSDAILLDVRSPQEYKEGHLDKSINIPLYNLENSCDKIIKNKENTIIVYCQSGNRTKRAIKILKALGYINIYEIEGRVRQNIV